MSNFPAESEAKKRLAAVWPGGWWNVEPKIGSSMGFADVVATSPGPSAKETPLWGQMWRVVAMEHKRLSRVRENENGHPAWYLERFRPVQVSWSREFVRFGGNLAVVAGDGEVIYAWPGQMVRHWDRGFPLKSGFMIDMNDPVKAVELAAGVMR